MRMTIRPRRISSIAASIVASGIENHFIILTNTVKPVANEESNGITTTGQC
jgi:hypothetical protein